jgi:hypothetical protein
VKACGIERQHGVGDRKPSVVALEGVAGPEPYFWSGAPSIVWRDESFSEIGSDPLGEVGETSPHRSGPAHELSVDVGRRDDVDELG